MKSLHNMFKLSQEKQETFLKLAILTAAAILSFAVRLFSVLRYESVIHEFDPYFNYRTTQFLTLRGFYDFHNWFDDRAWYPLGRIIGGTIYPGLMITSAALHHIAHALHITLDIRNICVFLAPLFSSLTTLVTYALTRELVDSSGAGLTAAAMIAIVPGYISRSVAGSYDNEGIAIFCMLATFYAWLRAVKTGSVCWAASCALAYLYMVSSWGGYVFLVNVIPIHVLVVMLTNAGGLGSASSPGGGGGGGGSIASSSSSSSGGGIASSAASAASGWLISHRVYVAYSTWFCLATILSMQISFVGFAPVQTSEHMIALGVFGLCQIAAGMQHVRSRLTASAFSHLLRVVMAAVAVCLALVLAILSITGKVAPWTGRFYSLLDPSYAKNNIPIIASVSEHQPTAWSSFYFDLQLHTIMFPVGLYYCFKRLTDANLFIITYGVFSIYFAGVMVRLMLVLAPVMCALSGIAISNVLWTYCKNVHETAALSSSSADSSSSAAASAAAGGGVGVASSGSSGGSGDHSRSLHSSRVSAAHQQQHNYPMKDWVAMAAIGIMSVFLALYSQHCIWVTSEAYSSPSIVLSARGHDNSRIIFDDFREAYYWLRQNTPADAKVMSWWDYGYQITAMANRTILVDNNTWNNTHISRVGQAMASSEDRAYPIMRQLDVNYVLVIFGGLTGYSSDDINKFLWMVRIGGNTPEGFHIKEHDYYTPQGEFRVDKLGSKTMLNSLMYKMCYYRFSQMYTEGGKPPGYDRVRNQEIGNKNFELDVLEEAYTTEHWIVRIYKVKNLANRGSV